jgi:hypothetical protein
MPGERSGDSDLVRSKAWVVVAVVAALVLGGVGGFAVGARQSRDRADGCQATAQAMYDLFRHQDPSTQVVLDLGDACPIEADR